MKRDPRLSRALVSGVGGTLALAAIFWAYNLGKSHGGGSAQQPQQTMALLDPALTAQVKTPLAPAPTTPPIAATTQPTRAQPELLAATTQRSADGAQTAAGRDANSNIDIQISGNVIAEAKGKLESGKLLDARRMLNAALSSGSLSEAETKNVKQLLSQINEKVIFSPGQVPGDELTQVIKVPPGGSLGKLAVQHDMDIELLMRMNNIKNKNLIKADAEMKVIRNGPFNALVDKSDFTMELWLGDPGSRGSIYVTSYPVGLGANDSTPAGVWAVSNKLTNPAYYSPRGEGVIDADDPKNPLGERWIALTGTEGLALGKTSYGIHGTIEPETIGKEASMGCIRMRNEDVARVYETLVPGKSIVVVRD